jgi:putative Holliday junction resolvase
MAAADLLQLPHLLGRGVPLAGLDLGSRTIGVAVSDTSLMIASPLGLIERRKFTTDAEARAAIPRGPSDATS